MGNEYLYINSEERDDSIYRIFNVEYFTKLANLGKNTLVSPKKWGDPFENYFLNLPILTDSGTAKNRHSEMVFGQCWTLTEESDALWRIYSPCKTGIKVKTSIANLFESFKEGFADTTTHKHCYIGKVQYYNPNDLYNLESQFEGSEKFSLDGSLEAHQLLFKRKAFHYENEVRLIGYFFQLHPNNEMIHYAVDPFKLFSEIVLDPRLSNGEFSHLKEMLVKIGFEEKIIKKSDLYTFNKSELRVLKHNFIEKSP